MKAITLTQPWATLVALLMKLIESRSWSTTYRGTLLIHAGAGLGPVGGMRGLYDLVEREPFHTALCNLSINGMIGWWGKDVVRELPRGAIVAVCELALVVPVELVRSRKAFECIRLADRVTQSWQITEQELAFGDYSAGRFAWLLADVRALPEPVPCRGALGLWTPDAATMDAVRRQVQL